MTGKAGCPRGPIKNKSLAGVLVATVRGPKAKTPRQAQLRAHVPDKTGVGGQPGPIFELARRPRRDTEAQLRVAGGPTVGISSGCCAWSQRRRTGLNAGECRCARPRSVHHTIQGLAGTVPDWPDICQLTDRITLTEKFWRTRALRRSGIAAATAAWAELTNRADMPRVVPLSEPSGGRVLATGLACRSACSSRGPALGPVAVLARQSRCQLARPARRNG